MSNFIVVDRNPYRAVSPQKLSQEFQSGIHHAKPLVMAGEVFSFFADNVAEPLLDFGRVHIIVVDPPFVACVVWRIYVDTLDFARIVRQERFQRHKIVALNKHISRILVATGQFRNFIQQVKRHLLIVIYHSFFANPVKRRHITSYPLKTVILTILRIRTNTQTQ